ncbi:hypothetical protein V6N13_121534 [Hibiscus sabdariffa]
MSLIHVLLFASFGTLASLVISRTFHDTAIVDKHEQWMVDYGRKYDNNLEKEKRLNIFMENLEYIESFNNVGNKSFKLGLNEFADMTHDEFIAAHTGYKMLDNSKMYKSTSFLYENFSDTPSSLNWNDRGAVTPVKDQSNCAVEGIIKIKTGKLISLSEQQLLDCSTNGGNEGCGGGWMTSAFKFIIQNRGISREESYPYKAEQRTCDMKKHMNKAATITGYETVPKNDEKALLKAVANQPVSVGIDGSGRTLCFSKVAGCLPESVEMIKTMRSPSLDTGGVKKVWTTGSSRIHGEKVGVKKGS